MGKENPDIIHVETAREKVLSADSAVLVVVTEGASAFSGDRAFKKAAEVNDLVVAIEEIGLDGESVSILDVRMASDSFVGIKSSSCKYTVQIRDVPTDLVPKALAVVASRKQARLESLAWEFSNLEGRDHQSACPGSSRCPRPGEDDRHRARCFPPRRAIAPRVRDAARRLETPPGRRCVWGQGDAA